MLLWVTFGCELFYKWPRPGIPGLTVNSGRFLLSGLSIGDCMFSQRLWATTGWCCRQVSETIHHYVAFHVRAGVAFWFLQSEDGRRTAVLYTQEQALQRRCQPGQRHCTTFSDACLSRSGPSHGFKGRCLCLLHERHDRYHGGHADGFKVWPDFAKLSFATCIMSTILCCTRVHAALSILTTHRLAECYIRAMEA